MGEAKKIAAPDGEWVVEVARRGVNPHQLQERWEAIERLHGANIALAAAADDLTDALGQGIEGHDSRGRVAAARAEFDQVLAEFTDRASETQSYAGGV